MHAVLPSPEPTAPAEDGELAGESAERDRTEATVFVAAATTTNTDGEALAGTTLTLDLPRSGTYVIEATLTAQQLETQSVTGWVLQNTYPGPFNGLALSGPRQVAVDSTGRILIADTGNARLVILASDGTYSTGITGLTGIVGVCVDASDNIYVLINAATSLLKKYTSALVLQYSNSIGPNVVRHLCTDSTHVYITVNNSFVKVTVAGAYVTAYGNSGSGDGQFNTPWGIVYAPGFNGPTNNIVVADSGNNRLSVWTTAGVFEGHITGFSSPRGLTGINASTFVFVADFGTDRIIESNSAGAFVSTFTQTDPEGVAVNSSRVVWTNNVTAGTVAKWDEASTPGGYGQIAIAIDGVVSDYLGIGNRDGFVSNVATATKAGGPGVTCTVEAYAKATSGTVTLKGLVLSARATPNR